MTTLAHGIHYAIIAVGLGGLVLLLAPRFLPARAVPRDAHEARVLALREAASSGRLTTVTTYAGPPVPARPSYAGSVLVPLAVVAAASAAGVHAAAGPSHFREATLFGVFFVGCALLQLLWAGALAARVARPLLVVGAVGNLAVVALWAVTRTAGLPFGLLPTPEAVGPWDLACGAWELVVAGCCLALLRRTDVLESRLVEVWRWHPAVQAFAAGSVVGLVVLSFSGAGS